MTLSKYKFVIFIFLIPAMIYCNKEDGHPSAHYFKLEKYAIHRSVHNEIDTTVIGTVIKAYKCPRCKIPIELIIKKRTRHECGYTSFVKLCLTDFHDRFEDTIIIWASEKQETN